LITLVSDFIFSLASAFLQTVNNTAVEHSDFKELQDYVLSASALHLVFTVVSLFLYVVERRQLSKMRAEIG